MELLKGGRSIASVRASAEGPVEVAMLTRETFSGLLKASNITQKQFSETVQERIKQNKVAGRTRRSGLW